MRVSSLFGPAILLPVLVQALSFDAIDIPDLDLSSLGRVAITGDFNGVSLYQYEGQTEITERDGSYILTPLPNGFLTNLSSADAQIRSMCPFTKKDGTFAGIFVGGNFTTLGGVDSPGAALFNPNSSVVTALDGLNGTVSAVLCDQNTNSVYVGGNFSYGNNTNAVAWTPDNGWTDLSFGGLNGPVDSILKADNGHIIFGGSFTGLGNSTSNSTSSNSTSTKNRQTLNLKSATITSDATSSLTGYEDPSNIICSTSGKAAEGQTWLLDDYSPGYWRADLGFEFYPTIIRLYNTHLDGRGTKTFSLKALPDDGIMNLTYTDDSGNKVACDQSCTLTNSTTKKYHDFTLVNPVGMKGFEINIQDYYGAGAGLNGIEVFQDRIMAYAIDDYNEPTCAGIKYPSKSTLTGTWTAESETYMSASVTDSSSDDTAVVFEPDVNASGNYTILLYTPGCTQDNTCDSRGLANVTVTAINGTDTEYSNPSSTTIAQTNEDDKYDPVYTGYVDASSGSFRPRVTVRPVSGQGDITFVALSVQFQLLSESNSSSDSSSSSSTSSSNSTGKLNGLYDYDPTSKTTANVGKSAINKAGKSLGTDALVTSLAEESGVIYVGGNFSNKTIHNIMSITDSKATALSGGGLNAGVQAMAMLDSTLYVGGNFTDTSDGGSDGLYYVASYSTSSKTWSALGDGLNGPVDTIYPIQLNVSSEVNGTTIAVSGRFNQIRASGSDSATYVPGFAIWLPSNKTWLESLNVTQMEFAGQLSAVTTYNGTSILAGSLSTAGLTASDALWLQNPSDDLSLLPLSMNINNTKSSLGLVTGAYDTDSTRNLTIFAGQFSAKSSNGSAISTIAFLNSTDSKITGLPQGVDSNSTVMAVLVYNDTLFAGGEITGTIGDSSVNGFLTYNLTTQEFTETQPWKLHGDNVTVNSIVRQPDSSNIYIGGNFDSAGSLPCQTVCTLDSTDASWSQPGVTISGTVIALSWSSSTTLYAAGDLEISGDSAVVATYDTKTLAWTGLTGASNSSIPGPISVFTPATQDNSEFWVAGTATNGSAFFMKYEGSAFSSPGNMFSEGTVIRGLEILPINDDHSSVHLLNNDQTLLIMGQLIIPDFGNASAALYNGTAVTPFILSSKSNGDPGSMSQLITEDQNPYSSTTKHHSNGIVVLVAFCCALGCVFALVAAGVVMNKVQRRRQGYSAAPQTFGTDRPTDMQRVPPEYLFNSLGHAHPGAPTI